MKTPNSLEEQLRSWTPRRPAPAIEERLFGTANATQPALNPRGVSWHWQPAFGAAAVACLLLMTTALNVTQWAGGRSESFSLGLLSASNRSELATLALASAPHNTWSAPILGWTNGEGTGSSIRPLYPLNTNHSLR